MLCLDIPNSARIMAEHLILDFNGTIAIDNVLIPSVRKRFEELSPLVTIHVVTADTNGTARSQFKGFPCRVEIIGEHGQDREKLEYARDWT